MTHLVVAPDVGHTDRDTHSDLETGIGRRLSQDERDTLLTPLWECYVRLAAQVYRRAEAEGRLAELYAGTYRIDRYPGKPAYLAKRAAAQAARAADKQHHTNESAPTGETISAPKSARMCMGSKKGSPQ